MKVNLNIGVKCEYAFVTRKAITDSNGNRIPGPVTNETDFTRNTLTTRFFDDALSEVGLGIKAVVVGEGTATPAESDTTLATYKANTTTLQSFAVNYNTTTSPRYVEKVYTYRFGEGVAAGNLTEVGFVNTAFVGTLNASSPVSSRALIKNAGGVPITLSVASDEYLDVVLKMTWYVPEDVTGSTSFSIRGVATTVGYTIRALGMSDSLVRPAWNTLQIGVCPGAFVDSGYDFDPGASTTASLQAYTADPMDYIAVGTNRLSSMTAPDLVPGSKNRTFKFLFGLDRCNIAVQSFFFKNYNNFGYSGGIGAYQILLDSPLPTKLNTESLAFYVNMSLSNAP